MSKDNDKLAQILKTLEDALARKPAPIRPEDFQVTAATSIKVIHGSAQSWSH